MRSFLCAIVAILALIFHDDVARAQGVPRMFEKGPYLQELSSSAVTIRFELPMKNAATVEVTHEGDAPITVVDRDETTFHSIRVEKLKPATRYQYAVNVRGALSTKGEIVTAPPDDSQAPFTFLIYGDNRTDADAHAAVIRVMKQSPSDFLVNTGDFVQSGSNGADWQSFFDVESPYLRDRCLFSSVGNHELYDDAAGTAYLRYFGPSPAFGSKLYSTMRWGNTRFFFLNAFDDWGSEARAWLDGALNHADTEPGLAWRIAVAHQGAWSSGPHGSSKKLNAAGIPALLRAHKIDLLVSGHDHIYERGEASGVRYLVSGGGGAPLYRDVKALSGTQKLEAAYHFIEVSVTDATVKLVAKRADGSVLERAAFGKSPGWTGEPPPSTMPQAVPQPASPVPSASPAPAPQSRCGCVAVGARGGGGGAFASFAAFLFLLFRARRQRR